MLLRPSCMSHGRSVSPCCALLLVLPCYWTPAALSTVRTSDTWCHPSLSFPWGDAASPVHCKCIAPGHQNQVLQ